MFDIATQNKAGRYTSQDIFLFHIREQMKALGATSVIWQTRVSKCRTYTELLRPFIVVGGDLLLPRPKFECSASTSGSCDTRDEILSIAKNQSFDKINRTEDGVICIKEVELDVSGILDVFNEFDILEYAFGCDNLVWMTLDSYFVKYGNLCHDFD
jgi:hypothetical protein